MPSSPLSDQSDVGRFWGDPVPAHEPPSSTIQIDTMHEGVVVLITRPDRITHAICGPDQARTLADSLLKAAKQWEED